jgi:16S rRNA (guanine527-N7)-methyltransferase
MADLPSSFDSGQILAKYNADRKIGEYLDYLLEYNRKINLVSRETSRDDLNRIAADCLIPFEFIEPPAGRIFDIGPGGGFPSVVLMLAFPNIKALLIERTAKKVVFLREVIKLYNLRAEVRNDNFVDLSHQLGKHSFDSGFMKLVRLDDRILRSVSTILKRGGRFVYYSTGDKNIKLPENLSVRQYAYYLDDSKIVRTISVFSMSD